MAADLSPSSSWQEKQDVLHEEHVATPHDKAFETRTIRKIDVRLLIILGLIYAISLIDRTNISTARTLGMAKDLKLTVGDRYSIISLVYFIPSVLFELPANLVIRRVGARNLLAFITVFWGAIMLAMGFVKTWQQLLALRVLLGLGEAGFFPCCVFIISTYYLRFETQKRMALFYLTSMALSGLSGIIGYGISLIGHAHGLAPWRWLFICFGAATIGLGIISYFLIADFVDKNKFLSKEQTDWVIGRINRERGDAEADDLSWGHTLKHAVDWKIWLFGLCFFGSTVPAYAFAYFLPVILAGGGYSVKWSLTLSAFPYLAAACYTFVVAYASDKRRHRAGFICLNSTVCIIGLAILAYTKPLGVRYFGCFLAIAGCQANIPATLTYSSNNITSHSKRAFSSAMVIGLGGIGGIAASLVFRQQDYPKYIPGLWFAIGCQLMIIIIVCILTSYFIRKNKQVESGTAVVENQEGFTYAL